MVMMSSGALRSTCCNLVPGWQKLPPQSLLVEEVTGGLSNKLTKISRPSTRGQHILSNTPSEVLVREYGHGGSLAGLDRTQEEAVVETLAGIGLAPPIIATFPTGRIETFLDASRLQCKDLRDISNLESIGKLLGQVHAQEPVAFSGELAYQQSLTASLAALQLKVSGQGEMSDAIRAVLSVLGLDSLAELGVYLSRVYRMVGEVASPVVFCHNDVQEGNILRSHTTNTLSLIDFEYSAYNPRAMDFANFFCETQIDNFAQTKDGFTISSTPPSTSQYRAFFTAYISSSPPASSSMQCTADELWEETLPFMSVSHLVWALWSLAQHEHGKWAGNGFNYLGYAITRAHHHKELFGTSGESTEGSE